jgi:hypothetical protein
MGWAPQNPAVFFKERAHAGSDFASLPPRAKFAPILKEAVYAGFIEIALIDGRGIGFVGGIEFR